MESQFPELAALKVLGGINKIVNSISRILCRLCDILYKKVPEIRQASVARLPYFWVSPTQTGLGNQALPERQSTASDIERNSL